jgi:hypothetical protein
MTFLFVISRSLQANLGSAVGIVPRLLTRNTGYISGGVKIYVFSSVHIATDTRKIFYSIVPKRSFRENKTDGA